MLIKSGKRVGRMGIAQPLGLLYLISTLRERYPGKYQIDLVEQALYDLTTEDLVKRFKNFAPDLVGFSTISMEAEEMERAAKAFKQENPEVKTVLGGPHATVFYDRALKSGNLDYICLNEGERTFPELLQALEQDQPLEQVPGLAFMKEGEIFLTPEREFIEDLDTIPFPAWDLIDFERYSVQISMNSYCHSTPWANLFTTRACPFSCVYCHRIFGKKLRKRSVENVIAEIELLTKNYGIKELQIIDDIFNCDLERAKKICDEIVSRGIEVKLAFPNGLRADLMDQELIKKLKLAGCYAITYAIETASPRLQKLIRKNLNLEKARQVIEWTYQAGINPHAFTMLGFPTETREELEQTIDWTLHSQLLTCSFFTVVVYPRTELLEIARRFYPNFDFSNYDYFDFNYYSETPFYSRVTSENLYKIQRSAYRRFYLRPSTILKILWRFPKNMTLIRGSYWILRRLFPSLFKLEKIFRPLRKFLNKHFGLFPE